MPTGPLVAPFGSYAEEFSSYLLSYVSLAPDVVVMESVRS